MADITKEEELVNKYLDREYVEIIEENGEKWAHFLCYYWWQEELVHRTDYTWLMNKISVISEQGVVDWYEEWSPKVTQYQYDLTEDEAYQEIIASETDDYGNDISPTLIDVDEFNEDLDCGFYLLDLNIG